jgi:hypothetical protein
MSPYRDCSSITRHPEVGRSEADSRGSIWLPNRSSQLRDGPPILEIANEYIAFINA